MKFGSYLVVFGLCALILQLAVVNCQTDDVATDAGNTEDTDATDIENAEDSGGSVDNSGGSDDENEVDGENNDDNSEVDQSADNSSADDVSNSEDNSTNEEDSNPDTGSDDTDETDVVESTDDENTDVVVDDTPEPPAVGTTLSFTMESRSAGEGVDVTIYFTQMSDALQMHCEISAEAGTSAINYWPEEFPSAEGSESVADTTGEEDTSGSEGTADEESGANDSNTVVVEESADSTDEEANEDSGSNDDEETSGVEASNTEENSAENIAEVSTDNADTPETDGDSETVDSVIDTEEGSDDSEDDSNINTDNEVDNTGSETDEGSNDASDVNEGDEDSATGQNRATTCSGTMPHLYLLKDTTCCSDPTQAQCASSEAKLLGCIEATGTVEHDFTDLEYYQVEQYCLAITDKQVDASFLRTPKFIAAGPSFFRTFSLFNFNSVNFLSSGTKTITSSASTGAVSVNFHSPSPSYGGGSYTPGLLDTLPHIRLEGVSADYVNVVIVLLMLTYLATVLFPVLNLGSLFSGISGPFSRMGDFAYEKMDVIADKVRASIRNYNRRYYNNIRRVDYDLNYEYYDDEDYYYYVK